MAAEVSTIYYIPIQYNSLPKLDNNNYYGRKYPGPKAVDGVARELCLPAFVRDDSPGVNARPFLFIIYRCIYNRYTVYTRSDPVRPGNAL